MGIVDVGTHLQPFLDLIVGLQTSGETLVVRAMGDTVVVEVVLQSSYRNLYHSLFHIV